jgi:hypothetical protein
MEKYVKQLQKLFGGLDRAHGTYKIDDNLEGDKVGGQAKTIATPPTAELWELHLKGERSLGIIPIREDGTVVWACIDIDAYKSDVCQTSVDFVKEYGLPFIICRSKSGGAHVFIFFKEPVAAKNVVNKLAQFAKAMGFDGAEVFPKQVSIGPDEFGNWLNMPYFDWEISARYAYGDEGQRLELPEFLEYAESRKVTFEAWKALPVPELEHPFNDGPPCLQQMARAKVGEGGRNNALLQFGVYAKLKYGEEEYQDKVAEYNHLYFTPPVGQREMTDTIFKSLSRRDYGYVCTQQPQASFCNRTACLRRRHGIGGAADEEFEATMEMHNLRKLLYLSPTGQPLDDDPEWELTVQGRTIRFSTSQLTVQSQFAARCINKLNIWPPPLPNPRWREMMQSHLNNCEDVEIPFETSPPAQTLEELKAYISRNAHAKNNLDLLNGLALKNEDCYRFRLESLVEFIRDKSRSVVNMKTIADHLELLGLRRSKTTARQGADHVSIVYWEVGVKQLEIYEDDFEQEVNQGVAF